MILTLEIIFYGVMNGIGTNLDLIRILQYQDLAIKLFGNHPHGVTDRKLNLIDFPAIGPQLCRFVLYKVGSVHFALAAGSQLIKAENK